MTDTRPPRCRVCHGELIGGEVEWDTCGDCGNRSIHPSRLPKTETEAGWSDPVDTLSILIVGLPIGLGFGLLFLVLAGAGWAAGVVAGWAGGWVNLLTFSTVCGVGYGVAYRLTHRTPPVSRRKQ